jgi:hypothetical protein
MTEACPDLASPTEAGRETPAYNAMLSREICPSVGHSGGAGRPAPNKPLEKSLPAAQSAV